jgi:glycogen operon protein
MLAEDRGFYFDTTGTGNTVNLRHPRVLQMVMDSLRYWVEECHVDGFRFDLTTSLGREYDHFDANAVFFDAIAQDPVLSCVKLIAEPWDIGPNGYQLGNFPPGWAEWNGRFRDDMRSFWKGDSSLLPGLASGMMGSASLFDRRGRKPWASLNFVTAHDGFTLTDLYTYSRKYNEANLEDNRDGHDDNRSWNCGVEGPTNHREILDLRDRMRRNLMAVLLLSHGHAHDPDGRRIRPHPARQQQRVLSGQRDRLDEVGRTWRARNGAGGFRAQAGGFRARQPLLRSGRFMHGQHITRDGLAMWPGSSLTGPPWTRLHGVTRWPTSSAGCCQGRGSGSCCLSMPSRKPFPSCSRKPPSKAPGRTRWTP